jgi:hypothetical protein
MIKGEGSKFLVPRNRWFGEKSYHYCKSCDEVVGISQKQAPVCTACGQNDLPDIFSILDKFNIETWNFIESIRLKEGPFGRFKVFRSADRQDNPYGCPPAPYNVWISICALDRIQVMKWCGYDIPYTREQLEEWMDTVMLDYNPETGYLEDSWLIRHKGRSKELEEKFNNMSRRFAIYCTRMGYPDKFRVKEDVKAYQAHLADPDTARKFLENDSLGDTNPWGKGAQVVWAVWRHKELLSNKGLPDDGMIEWIHNWLDEHQNPETGYWFGQNASLNNSCCGVFKILILYQETDWFILEIEKIIDTTLSLATPYGGFGESGVGCTLFDPIMVLDVCSRRKPDYRQNDICQAVANSFKRLNKWWSEEEHFYRVDLRPNGECQLTAGNGGVSTAIYMAQVLIRAEIFSAKDRNETQTCWPWINEKESG